MTFERDAATARQVLGQGHILEALADGEAITGTLKRLGRQFGLTPDELQACLLELTHAGWIVVQTQPFGRLSVRLERRSSVSQSVALDRRRPVTNFWPF